jgi:hypothetical protein
MKAGVEGLIADHYQKTFELTLTIWEQRNRTFLILLAVVGAASLLTFNVAQAEPLLVDLIANVMGIEDSVRRNELRVSFPYGLIQSILLMVVLYLTLILYHRTAFITRSYQYLSRTEDEIRLALELNESAVLFSREGRFYSENRPRLSSAIGTTYILMLGMLLLAFLGARLFGDLESAQYLLGVVDLLLSIFILMFFREYALASTSYRPLRLLLGRP